MPTDDVDPVPDPPDRIDAVARRAGAELRRPAPADGAALVQRSVRRRRTAVAAGGGLAAVAMVAGGIVLAIRGGDDETVVGDDPAPTTVSLPQPSTTPTIPSPGTTIPATAPSETIVPSGTTGVPETTVPPPSSPGSSDEVLADPLAVAADGRERELAGRELIVRGDPEQVIPLDLPETWLWLYGVGPNGVAYLRAEDDGLTRILAVPTTGPTTGAVYELVAPYEHDGPWLGFMTPEGIDPFTNSGGPGIVPYVDPDGRPLAEPVDPTFTWRLEYRLVDDGNVRPLLIDASGYEHELPVTEPGREGQFDRWLRPLPDGRVTVTIRGGDGAAQVWSFDPSTGGWTVHPSG